MGSFTFKLQSALRRIPLALLIATLVLPLFGTPAYAAEPPPSHLTPQTDFPVPGGYFFKQANGMAGKGDSGYAVLDDNEAKFWSEFQRLGGVDALGYPTARRFRWGGFTVQVFQRGVLQWRPDVQQAWLVNVFDLMHDMGHDNWLQNFRSTPKPLDPSFDAGKDWAGIVRARQALLDANPAIRDRYWDSPDPMTFFGLPTSRVTDNGNHFVIRLQRAVIQQWKVDMPWAKAGQVTVANGGDIASEAGLFPTTGFDVESPSYSRNDKIVALDPGHGGGEVGSARTKEGGPRLVEKELNLTVALRVAAYLAANGYRVVLTRNADTRVNQPARELTGDKAIDLQDDLQARIDIANNAGAQALVSIHFNGYTNPELKGTAVHYTLGRPMSNQSLRLSQALQANLVQNLRAAGYKDLVDRGVQDDTRLFGPRGHLYLLGGHAVRPSEMPGALSESLFITNAADAAQLARPEILQAVSLAHAQGIAAYFGLPFAENPPVVPPPTPTPPPATPPPGPPGAAGARLGRVEAGGRGATLRAEPDPAARALRTLPDNTQVTILQAARGGQIDDDARWYRVTADGQMGFVYAPLVANLDPRLALPSPRGTAHNPAGAGVNARSGPRTDQAVVQVVPNGTTVEVLDVVLGQAVEANDPRWYHIMLNDTPAYVYSTLLRVDSAPAPPPTATPAPPPPTPTASPAGARLGRVQTAGRGATLRAEPNPTAQAVRALSDNTQVTIVQAVRGAVVSDGENRWYKVTVDGQTGFVYAPLVVNLDPRLALPPSKGTVRNPAGPTVNTRTGPRADQALVRVLPNGTAVEVLDVVLGQAVEANEPRWYHIMLGDTPAYVYAPLLRVE